MNYSSDAERLLFVMSPGRRPDAGGRRHSVGGVLAGKPLAPEDSGGRKSRFLRERTQKRRRAL